IPSAEHLLHESRAIETERSAASPQIRNALESRQEISQRSGRTIRRTQRARCHPTPATVGKLDAPVSTRPLSGNHSRVPERGHEPRSSPRLSTNLGRGGGDAPSRSFLPSARFGLAPLDESPHANPAAIAIGAVLDLHPATSRSLREDAHPLS